MPDVEVAQDVEDDTWGSALSASFDKQSAEVEPEPAAAAEPSPATPAAEAPTPAESAPAPEGRARDEKGRFVPKAPAGTSSPPPAEPKEAPGGVAPDAAPIGTTPPAPVPEALKAPQSWRPAEREAFSKAPREVQEAAIRREREVQGVLQESAEARRLSDAFRQVIAPYEALMRQSGATHPLQAVDRLLQTAHILNTGTAQQRAQTIAGIVQQYLGMDDGSIQALDQALQTARAGKPAQQQLDPRALVDQAKQELARELAASRQQQAWRESSAEMEKFKANAEFLEDVKADMADLLEMASRRGVELSLEDAYKKACTLHPEVSRVMQQREATKQAATAQAATQRAKAAASSVKSSPGAASYSPPEPDDWRSALEAQWK